MKTNNEPIETWTNHCGTFARDQGTGAHYGPFRDAHEAELAIRARVQYHAQCQDQEQTSIARE